MANRPVVPQSNFQKKLINQLQSPLHFFSHPLIEERKKKEIETTQNLLCVYQNEEKLAFC
jgi:hypothetical protein